MLPNKTFKMKGKKLNIGKKGLERISVFVWVNMKGTEKLNPIVIRQSSRAAMFQKREITSYHVWEQQYFLDEKWHLFWVLKKLNKDMLSQNRKIGFRTNVPHIKSWLSDIKLIILPSNTTSVLQPMDMGVIHAIKCLYRVKEARKLLVLIETKPNPTPKGFDLFDALKMFKQPWDKISVETVKNCFVKSGFQLNSVESIEMPEISVWD